MANIIPAAHIEKPLIELYAIYIYPLLSSPVSRIASLVPFSLSGITIIFVTVYTIRNMYIIIFKKGKRKKYIIKTLLTISGLLIWMFMSWGILYARPDWYNRNNTHKAVPDSVSYCMFMDKYISNLNESYLNSRSSGITEGLNTGYPVEKWWKDPSVAKIDSVIELSYKDNKIQFGINWPNGKRRPKPVFFEKYYTKTSILGFFLPIFHETHINREQPFIQFPFSLAHEKAHQFGITSEAECNMYAYLACTLSDEPYTRYSGYFGVLGYILSDARRVIPYYYKEYISQIHPEIKTEYNNVFMFWRDKEDKKLAEIQTKVHDTYLRASGAKSGIRSYSEVTALLLTDFMKAHNPANQH